MKTYHMIEMSKSRLACYSLEYLSASRQFRLFENATSPIIFFIFFGRPSLTHISRFVGLTLASSVHAILNRL